jgi:hypothetical protein
MPRKPKASVVDPPTSDPLLQKVNEFQKKKVAEIKKKVTEKKINLTVEKVNKPLESLGEINDLDISSENFKLFLENKKLYSHLNLKLENLRCELEKTEKEKENIVDILLNCIKKSSPNANNLLFLPKRISKETLIKPIIQNSTEEEDIQSIVESEED